MAKQKTYTLSRQEKLDLLEVIRRVLGNAGDTTTTPYKAGRPSNGFWALLGDEDEANPGHYKWTKKIGDGFSLVDDARGTTSGDDFSAVEANGRGGLEGTYVWLRFDGRDETEDGKNPVWRFEQGADVVEVGIVQSIDACAGQCVTQPAGGGDNTTVNLIFPLGPVKVNFAVGDAICFIRSSSATGDAISPDVGEPAMTYSLAGAADVKVKKLTCLTLNNTQLVDGFSGGRDDFSMSSVSPAISGVTFCGSDDSKVGMQWAGFVVDQSGVATFDSLRKIKFDYTSYSGTGTPFDVIFEVSDSGNAAVLVAGTVYVDLATIPTPPDWAVYTGDGTWISVAGNVISHIGPGAADSTTDTVTNLRWDEDTLKIDVPGGIVFDVKGHEIDQVGGSTLSLHFQLVEMVSAIRFNANILEYKTREFYVPAALAESGWHTLVEFEDCAEEI